MTVNPNISIKLWKPVSARAVAIRIATCCPTPADKHFLLKLCEKSDNFSRTFFGRTKPKKKYEKETAKEKRTRLPLPMGLLH